jgi:hypothetical protein
MTDKNESQANSKKAYIIDPIISISQTITTFDNRSSTFVNNRKDDNTTTFITGLK